MWQSGYEHALSTLPLAFLFLENEVATSPSMAEVEGEADRHPVESSHLQHAKDEGQQEEEEEAEEEAESVVTEQGQSAAEQSSGRRRGKTSIYRGEGRGHP